MMSSFTTRVYEIVQQIPKGKVATYSQIAILAGNPKAARAVGMCMSHNKRPDIIPCHRVVAATGKLTGYAFGGTSSKQAKLQQEGVSIANGIVNLTASQWQC